MGSQEKKVVQEALRQVEERRQRRQGWEALRWVVGWWVLVLVVFFLAPWPLQEKIWAAAHGVCAQVPGHMLRFGDRLLPLCARDSGIYLGTLLGVAYLLARGRWMAAGRPPRWFWRVFTPVAVFFAADVANSVAEDWFAGGIYPPHNLLRLASGLLLGVMVAVLLLWAFNLSFAQRRPDRPILSHWGDVAGLLVVAAAAGLALGGGWAPLFVPLTVLTMLGMVGMLLAGCFLWFLMLLEGREPVDSGWEALPALFWAGVATVALIAALSGARSWLGL